MKKIGTALLIAAALTVHAQDGPKIWGGTDCGLWVKNDFTGDKTWLMGYLSGMNIAMQDIRRNTNVKFKDPLAELQSAQQAVQWMTNYCTKNPLETVQGGANELFFELVKRAEQRK